MPLQTWANFLVFFWTPIAIRRLDIEFQFLIYFSLLSANKSEFQELIYLMVFDLWLALTGSFDKTT